MAPLPVPCLALQQQQHGPESVKTTLFNIFEGQDIACDIDALTNNSSKFWVTPQGWILVHDKTSLSTFMFSPLNPDEKVQMPHLPDDLPRTSSCLLSDKPTLPGCIVLLVEPNANVIWHCGVDGKKWARHEYDIGTQLLDPVSDLHEKVPICPIAACRGKFYFNSESLTDIVICYYTISLRQILLERKMFSVSGIPETNFVGKEMFSVSGIPETDFHTDNFSSEIVLNQELHELD
uniref:Uncharacterized protein n=1 Tax=Oryza sativa subsp. japonica TaxID=39947 RepID=Q10CX2_ORYSJ|nr:hypothetical protein LOC_Os03g56780 [Oryza sativa Japonica Group]